MPVRQGSGEAPTVRESAEDEEPALKRPSRPPVKIAARLSLRVRFFVLFVVLGALALVPYFVAERNHQKLDGFATAIEEAGSLRYRLLEIQLEIARGSHTEDSRKHVETLLGAQRQLLALSASGDRGMSFAACPTADVCARFRAHMKRWDEQLEPRLRAALDDPTLAPKLEPEVYLELTELDLTVRAFARVIQDRTDRNTQLGLLASFGSMGLVAMAVFGVWSVFSRIERLRNSAEKAEEDELRKESRPKDELGSLAGSLVRGLASERAQRELEQQRTEELQRQQLATRQCAESLSAWIAGEGSLDAALQNVARATSSAGAALSHLPNGSGIAAMPSGAADAMIELSWGQKTLGTLELSGRPDSRGPSDAVLLDTLAQIVAIACLAERLLTEKGEQGRLAMALGSVAGRPTESDFGESLRRLIAHDAAIIELYDDQSHVEDVWAVHPQRLERLASVCEPHPPAKAVRALPADSEEGCGLLRRRCEGAQLEIPLSMNEKLIGSLILARETDSFSTQDALTAEALAPIVSGALARIQLEARLRFAEQWSTLGAFGRMLAHEIKNPLNSLGLELQLLERRIGKLELDDEKREKLVSSIVVVKNELARLTALTAEYLSLNPKSGDMVLTPIDLRTVATEVVRTHAAEMKERGIKLREDLGRGPALVHGNAARLTQLLHNVLGNAIEAMSTQPVREAAVTITTNGSRVELSVADTGSGLADPIAIFAPGFSTKPSGTGMGLAISQQIARQHGGRLVARARTGGGAEFTLTLRAASEAESAAG